MASKVKNYVILAKSGDRNAFAELYKLTFSRSYFVAIKLLNNEQEAFSVVCDSYAEAFAQIDKLQNPEKFGKWIKYITAEKCKSALKKQDKSVFSDNHMTDYIAKIEDHTEFLPQNILNSPELTSFVINTVDSLPVAQKTTVYLYYYNNMSVANIAKSFSCSETTVKSWLYAARETIKTETEKCINQSFGLSSLSGIPVLSLIMRQARKLQPINKELFEKSLEIICENSEISLPQKKTAPENPDFFVQTVPQKTVISYVSTTNNNGIFSAFSKLSAIQKVIAIVAVIAVLGGIIGGAFSISKFDSKKEDASDTEEVSVSFIKNKKHLKDIPDGYTPIYEVSDLEKIRTNLNGKFILMNDLDMRSVENWDPIAGNAQSLEEIFRGVFDGNGYEIKNLTCKGHDFAALFGKACNATIINLSMSDVNIEGAQFSGAIVSMFTATDKSEIATLSNCHVLSGKINALYETGGIAGVFLASEATDDVINMKMECCSNRASVSGGRAGGIAGLTGVGAYGNVVISNVINYGEISGDHQSGGLFGTIDNDEGTVRIVNSVNAGIVNQHTESTPTAYTGLLSGGCDLDNDYSVEFIDCYYVSDTPSHPFGTALKAVVNDKTVCISEKDSHKKETYSALDFENIWDWNKKEKLPELRAFLTEESGSEPKSEFEHEFRPDITTEADLSSVIQAEEKTKPAKPAVRVTAKSSDFENLLGIAEEFIKRGYDFNNTYNCKSSDAHKMMYFILMDNYNAGSFYMQFFDDVKKHKSTPDPRKKFTDTDYDGFYSFPGENVDWIITNVFNLSPDHNAEGKGYYYHNGMYYVGFISKGDNFRDLSVESHKAGSDGTYTVKIKCETTLMGDETPYEIGYYTFEVALYETDSKKYWSVYSVKCDKIIEQEATLSEEYSPEIETTSPKEIPVTQTPANDDVQSNWQTAYNSYLKAAYNSDKFWSPENVTFGFGYINNDNIPELLISEGTAHASKVLVVTYVNGRAVEVGSYGSNGTMEYAERESVIVDLYSKSGNVYETIYRMDDDGSGKKIVSYFSNSASGNELLYKINDVEVTEEEFINDRKKNYPTSELITSKTEYAFTPEEIDRYTLNAMQ